MLSKRGNAELSVCAARSAGDAVHAIHRCAIQLGSASPMRGVSCFKSASCPPITHHLPSTGDFEALQRGGRSGPAAAPGHRAGFPGLSRS